MMCPTGIVMCTECSNGKGVDTSDDTCKGKFLVLLKSDLFSPHNENYYLCYCYCLLLVLLLLLVVIVVVVVSTL